MVPVLASPLREALKQKGIGPKGSKHLAPELLREVLPLLGNPQTNRATAAAFWTACLLLDNSAEEQALLHPLLSQPQTTLLPELQALMNPRLMPGDAGDFLGIIHQVIHHQDLSYAKAHQAMNYFWHDQIPDWIKGAFLQAERVKRESLEENLAFLESMWDQARRVEVNLPCLMELADSHDGTDRSYHLGVFVAPVLAAMGIPTLLNGSERQGPKYGITNAQLLKQAGVSSEFSLESIQAKLMHPQVGWGYVDKKVFFPKLESLFQLREDILKRPFLATFEKGMNPVLNRSGNILITGYVHAGYKEDLVRLLSFHNRNHLVVNMRTIEGSTNCWLKKPTPYVGYVRQPKFQDSERTPSPPLAALNLPLTDLCQLQGQAVFEGELIPEQFGLHRQDQGLVKEITVEEMTREGISALQGKEGLTQDSLLFHAAAFAWLGQRISDPVTAVEQARQAIRSGKAWAHWQAYGNTPSIINLRY